MWYVILKEGCKVTREQEFFVGYSEAFKPKFVKIEEDCIRPLLYTNIDAAIQESISLKKQGEKVIISPLAAIY